MAARDFWKYKFLATKICLKRSKPQQKSAAHHVCNVHFCHTFWPCPWLHRHRLPATKLLWIFLLLFFYSTPVPAMLLHLVSPNKLLKLVNCHVITVMYSFMCYFSKLEHIAHYKEQNTVKTNFHECAHPPTHIHVHKHTHTINRIVWRGEISKRMWKLWVCLMI